MKCDYCEEEILEEPVWATELSEDLRTLQKVVFHRECQFRLVMGSIAHQQHRCGCFVPGSTADDPPGMTLRQGAKAAMEYWSKNKFRYHVEHYAQTSRN